MKDAVPTLSDVPLAALHKVLQGFSAAESVNVGLVCRAWAQLLHQEEIRQLLATEQFGPSLTSRTFPPGCSTWRQAYRLLCSLVSCIE